MIWEAEASLFNVKKFGYWSRANLYVELFKYIQNPLPQQIDKLSKIMYDK